MTNMWSLISAWILVIVSCVFMLTSFLDSDSAKNATIIYSAIAISLLILHIFYSRKEGERDRFRR